MDTFPAADIIWWNANYYYVQCPFCDGVHRHGIIWEKDKEDKWIFHQLRHSHCMMRMKSYRSCFPMNHQGGVAYEIDKRQGRYTNICVSHGSDSQVDDDVDRLATELAQKAMVAAQREEIYASIDKDSKEEVTKDPGHGKERSKQKRIFISISDCSVGDVKAVQKYLDGSSEAQLFVRGRDSNGQTTLFISARGQSSAMVSLLIKHGADVNAVDNNGRTALMEAALFGWVDNVKVLLGHNADKTIRDGENRLAIDLARDHYKNREERYVRAGGQRPAYIEDTFRRDIDRKEIVLLLGGENRKSNIAFGRPPRSLLSKYSFERSPMQDSVVLCGPIEEYPITSSWKTVARLERGGSFPSVGAMSGWSHPAQELIRVDGRQWTDDVFYISEVVDHRLPSDGKDQGKDGQYNACHAEKQLIAYFIDRHVFLPRDSLPCSELEEKIKLKEDEIQEFSLSTAIGCMVTSLRKRKEDLEEELFDRDEKLVGKYDEIRALELKLDSAKSTLNRLIGSPEARPFLDLESQLDVLNQQQRRHNDLIKMANAPLPVSLTEADILVSSPPCRDCDMFKDKVNKFFGLSIQLHCC